MFEEANRYLDIEKVIFEAFEYAAEWVSSDGRSSYPDLDITPVDVVRVTDFILSGIPPVVAMTSTFASDMFEAEAMPSALNGFLTASGIWSVPQLEKLHNKSIEVWLLDKDETYFW